MYLDSGKHIAYNKGVHQEGASEGSWMINRQLTIRNCIQDIYLREKFAIQVEVLNYSEQVLQMWQIGESKYRYFIMKVHNKKICENRGYAMTYASRTITENNLIKSCFDNRELMESVLAKRNLDGSCKQIKRNKGVAAINGLYVHEIEHQVGKN